MDLFDKVDKFLRCFEFLQILVGLEGHDAIPQMKERNHVECPSNLSIEKLNECLFTSFEYIRCLLNFVRFSLSERKECPSQRFKLLSEMSRQGIEF